MKSCLFILPFLILFSIILSCQYAYSQKYEGKTKSSPEIMLSMNRTTALDKNSPGKFGFGVGVYYALFNNKRCNLIFGLEYNNNKLFVEHMTIDGRWGVENYNTTFSINNFGIPISMRVNMGKKVIFFVEAGVFFDLAIYGKKEGISKSSSYNPADSTITLIEEPFNNNASYESPNFGPQGGVGLRIPIQKFEILIKGDYKWGMRDLVNNRYKGIYNRYWRFSVGLKANF